MSGIVRIACPGPFCVRAADGTYVALPLETNLSDQPVAYQQAEWLDHRTACERLGARDVFEFVDRHGRDVRMRQGERGPEFVAADVEAIADRNRRLRDEADALLWPGGRKRWRQPPRHDPGRGASA